MDSLKLPRSLAYHEVTSQVGRAALADSKSLLGAVLWFSAITQPWLCWQVLAKL